MVNTLAVGAFGGGTDQGVATVYQKHSSVRSSKAPFTGASLQSFALRLTPPVNLPAPGRRQSVYIDLRLRTDLCFPVTITVAKRNLLRPADATLLQRHWAPLLPKLRG